MKEAIQPRHALVFGGTGAIGGAVVGRFRLEGWQTTVVSRSAGLDSIQWDGTAPEDAEAVVAFRERAPFDAVCWAQGQNNNDSVYDVDLLAHQRMYAANVLYIIASLNLLLTQELLAKPTRFVVISSIWQNLARQNKLSYCVTKAALQGLVLSAANDLGADGHLFNAVLPGVLETPMTRRNLTQQQIESVQRSTHHGRLATLDDVASSVFFLASPLNTGVTGQFLKVDLGFSDARII